MGKTWILDTETKGTGAHVVPLEKAQKESAGQPTRASRRRKRRATSRASGAQRPTQQPHRTAERRLGPLPPGHVRKKTTGELGRVRSIDSKDGTATVLWLKQGRTSTVPLSAISRR